MEFLFNKIKEKYSTKKTLIIGIDGLGGSGKSTIANSLKKQLQAQNYHAYILHIDDFIHPKHIRYNDSKEEWYCYYNIQWRYDYLVKEILSPIQKSANIVKQIELYDKINDSYILKLTSIPKGSILLIEGIFLQRKELKPYLDFTIYLHVPQEVRLNRVVKRDSYIGDFEEIKCKYEKRYFPAEEKYLLEYSPIENADFVINNNCIFNKIVSH